MLCNDRDWSLSQCYDTIYKMSLRLMCTASTRVIMQLFTLLFWSVVCCTESSISSIRHFMLF